MSNGKTIALGVVLFLAVMLAASALMRIHTASNREQIAQDLEKARERISAVVGSVVMLEESAYDPPWVCGAYRDPGGGSKQYFY